MSIASEITRINTNIANAYTACDGKGATMPQTQNSANLATCINSIQTGGGSFVGLPREVSNDGLFQVPTSSFTFSLPSNATNIATHAMGYAFYNCSGVTSADLSSLTTLNRGHAMEYAFYGCTNLTSVDLSSLTSAGGTSVMNNAFYGCRNLISVDLSSLTTISGSSSMAYAFYDCTNLTSVDLSSLTTVDGSKAMDNTFNGCSSLTSVDLSSLTTIGENNSSENYSQFNLCFNDCTNLTTLTFANLEKIYCTGTNSVTYGTFSSNSTIQKIYFPKLDYIGYGTGASSTNQNACKYVFYGCSALTELHFGAANQATIEASPGYSTAWGRGAGNVTIYFDL